MKVDVAADYVCVRNYRALARIITSYPGLPSDRHPSWTWAREVCLVVSLSADSELNSGIHCLTLDPLELDQAMACVALCFLFDTFLDLPLLSI